MRRKRRKEQQRPLAPKAFRNRPFQELSGRAQPAPVELEEPAEVPPVAPESDSDAFHREMSDVQPLSAEMRAVRPSAPTTRDAPVADEESEVLAELSDLVSGRAEFDINHTTEFIEGAVVGLDARLVRRLRRGELAYRDHLDLHRMTAIEARAAVDGFLGKALRSGQRCVLIVHGRGLNSPDGVPVLKQHVVRWLSRSRWARFVLAFTSARSCDGGAGALYVLLRRDRSDRKAVRVTEGAKW